MTDIEENELVAQRRDQLTALRENGQAYRNDFRREHLSANLVKEYGEKSKEEM
jgi:lysyl-tRNA synthetase class 2